MAGIGDNGGPPSGQEMRMVDLAAVTWVRKHGEWVAHPYGIEVSVRRAGKRWTAHYGPDRWIIGDFNSRYSTKERAQQVAVEYVVSVLESRSPQRAKDE